MKIHLVETSIFGKTRHTKMCPTPSRTTEGSESAGRISIRSQEQKHSDSVDTPKQQHDSAQVLGCICISRIASSE